jgi:hypothetical protein
MGKAGDAKVPGEPLGHYRVTADLQSSTCGEGALGSERKWQFEVRLSKQGSDLYWLNGREAIAGTIESDGVSFGFDTRIRVETSAAARGRFGCAIWRADSADGKFVAQGSEVTGFSGRLGFTYSPEANSDCSELIGVPGGFAGLPCAIEYAIAAERTSTK